MKTVQELLRPLAPGGRIADKRMIRLDLTPGGLRTALADGRLGVGGAHRALVTEKSYGTKAIVPDPPHMLGLEHYDLILPFLAETSTPDSLRVGFGPIPEEIDIDRAAAEATADDFISTNSSAYKIGLYGTGWLLDVLHNYPGETTTVIPRSNTNHATPGVDTAHYIGLHYDQQSRRPDGWTERLPVNSRINAGRRVLANIGPGQRRAIAGMNFSALQFAELFAPGDPDYLPRTTDLVTYVNAHPEILNTMALLHTVIKSGELAEITPANAVHDGSMLGCAQESTCIIFSMGTSPPRRFRSGVG